NPSPAEQTRDDGKSAPKLEPRRSRNERGDTLGREALRIGSNKKVPPRVALSPRNRAAEPKVAQLPAGGTGYRRDPIFARVHVEFAEGILIRTLPHMSWARPATSRTPLTEQNE